MKILVVTQYYYPESFIINDLVKSMVKKDIYVEVLTAIPNYPDGTFFKGYNFFNKKKEYINNITIHRARIFPRLKGNKLQLSLNYLSFVFFATLRLISIKGNFDKVLIYAPSPITVGLVGIFAAKKFKAKSYIWVQDLWPESVKDAGNIENTIILKLLNVLTKSIYSYIDLIFIQSQGFRDYIINQGVSDEKIRYVPNYAEELYKKVNESYQIKKKFNNFFSVTFAGNIGEAQNLDILVESAKILKSKSINVKFVIIGSGRKKDSLCEKVKNNKLDQYFVFLGRKSPSEMPKFFSSSEVLLITLKKSKIFSLTIPSKLQSYMACSKPILGSVDGITNRIIKESKSGFVSNSEDVNGLVANIIKFESLSKEVLKKMGENSKSYYNQNFSKKTVVSRIIKLMSN